MIADRPDHRRVEREAADWLTRLSRTPVETEALEAFYVWRKDPVNHAAYNRMEDIARAARDLRDDPDLRAAAREARTRQTWRKQLAAGARNLRLRWGGGRTGGGLAVAGLLAAGVVGWLALNANTYATQVGQITSVRLEDGSQVRLNTNSRVRVRFSHGERRVQLLRGQAYFEVAHDKARPFLVAAGPAEVRAVGTQFDVRKTDAEVRVTLAQGRVAVRDSQAKDHRWTLDPGQGIALGRAPYDARPVPVDVAAITSWREGKIIFHDVSLASAVDEINRYTHRKIVLGDGAPADILITGRFAAGDTDDFLSAVTALYGLRADRRLDGKIELKVAPSA